MIFRDEFHDTGIQIIIRPVDGDPYNARSWWKSWQGWKSTLFEYLKSVHYLAGFR